MNRKAFIQAAVLALSSTFALGAAAQAAALPPNKVVFQVSDGDAGKWNLALNNIKNVQEAFGAKNVAIELVVYGPGIGMLKAEALTSNRVIEAAEAGVKIVACETTMHALNLTKADMNPAIGYVPGGVVELMKLQAQGWAYIRP
jgi:uncharacterized protein